MTDQNRPQISIRVRIFRDLAGAVLAGLLFVLIVNRGVLLHRMSDNSGVSRITERAELSGAETSFSSDAQFILEPPAAATVLRHDGSAVISLDAFPTGTYIKRLVMELDPLTGRRVPVHVLVSCLENGSMQEYQYDDLQPLYLDTEVFDIDRDHIISISIYGETEDLTADPPFRIGQVAVDNRFRFDPYVFLFGFLAAFALLVLIDFHKVMLLHPECAFLLICLAMGVSMTTGLPRNKVGYDEETHLQAVMDMASFPADELHVSDAVMHQLLVTEYNHPDAQPHGMIEMSVWDSRLAAEADYKTGSHTPDFYTMPNRMPAYLAMAIGMKLGKGLNLSFPALLLLTRLANLLMYAGIMTLAIHICPRGKWLMMLIALFPVNVFLACTINYDPFITAFLYLGYALLLRASVVPDLRPMKSSEPPAEPAESNEAPLSDSLQSPTTQHGHIRYLAAALLCFVLACLPKAVYAPVALMALIAIRPQGKHGIFHRRTEHVQPEALPAQTHKKMHALLPAVALILVFVLLIAVFILPTVLAPSESGDIRGGTAVSEVSQIAFILHHPAVYAGILFRQIIGWVPQCWFGPDCTTYMGHIVNGTVGFRGFYQPYLVLLAVTVAVSWLPAFSKGIAPTELDVRGPHHAYHLTPGQRVWIFLMVGAASVLIWTAMYVVFTPPGATEIGGVQGRYFIPLMFPLYMVFSGSWRSEPYHALHLESGYTMWYYLLELAGLLLLALTVWAAVIRRFCV